MDMDEIENVQLPPGHGIMATMDTVGDIKSIWNRNNPEEVESIRKQFNDLKDKGYTAFKVVGKEGDKGEVMKTFDPEAERIIFAPRYQGG